MTVVYDKAKYHFGGDWPRDLPTENAYHHGGFYLGWLVERDMMRSEALEDVAPFVAEFRARRLTAPALYRKLDGVLTSDMLTEVGDCFTRSYFRIESGQYIPDYEDLMANGLPTAYHVADTWENYDRIRAMLDQRFAAWRSRPGAPQ